MKESAGRPSTMLPLWLALIHLHRVTTDFISDDKEIETLITGSKYSNGMGTVSAPPGYPDTVYELDATSHIFVLENVATEGSVELIIEDFDLHPLSWITVRNSKYGGYIGRVIGRYDLKNPPPGVIFTQTCCMRVEVQTGCCAPGEPGYSGFRATYKFVRRPGRGRRTSCDTDEVYNQLCNGECIPQVYSCPCPQYGQYKCANGMCLAREKVCNNFDDCGDGSEERLCKYIRGLAERDDGGSMYGFSVIISTVMAVVGTAFFLICAIRCVENRRSQKWKKILKAERLCRGPLPYAKIWPRPQVGFLPSPTPVRIIRRPLTVGRLPAVVVKPLEKPHKNHTREDEMSSSSHDESGFQGDDDVGLTSSSDGDVWVPRIERKVEKEGKEGREVEKKQPGGSSGGTCIGNG